MLYRPFGRTGIRLSALGFGTNRFPLKNINDEEGIANAADLLCKALDKGVNYIDIAHSYSLNKAEQVVRLALRNTKRDYHVTVKVSYFEDKTADDALYRIEKSLDNMGVDKVTFCYMWAIKSYEEYKKIMKKGSIYEGALRAKSKGLIEHICFSTHASVKDIIKIINDNVFDGVILSYNALNHKMMKDVLCNASNKKIGILTMNSLAGGIIPQNKSYFDCIRMQEGETVSQAALKFIYSNKEISSVLSGISNYDDLMENIDAFNNIGDISDMRIKYVEANMDQIKGFCTGCNYCSGCPMNIPISSFMLGYNAKLFEDTTTVFNRNNRDMIKNINMFKKIGSGSIPVLEDSNNPCIKCGVCEKRCTQNLPIINRLIEIFKCADDCCFNTEAKKQRLYDLIESRNYSRVGFYPSGRYTHRVIQLYKELFGNMQFTPYIFDSNSELWGRNNEDGIKTLSPKDIEKVRPECIIISNYIHSEEIYNSIKQFESIGINIVKLHNDKDVPWFFQ